MKRNDLILIVVILVLALLGGGYYYLNREEGAKVVILVDGERFKELPLNQNTSMIIETGNDHINELEIKDGYATIKEANCPDKRCVHQKDIHYEGESLVCMPHQVIVTVEGGETSDLDSVAQ